MTNKGLSPDSTLTAEAADWYARLRAGNVSEIDAVRFRAWIASNPAHRREFEQLDFLWEDLRAIEQSPEALRELSCEQTDRTPDSGTEEQKVFRRPKALSWTLAASVLIAIGMVTWVQTHPSNYYETGVGEQRVIPLKDGSVVTLNTASELRLRYSDSQRAVELLSGQANFEVAKDPRRPFIVKVGNGEVRAVGTVFDVYKAHDKVTVTLIEGKVAVVPDLSAALAALEERERVSRETQGVVSLKEEVIKPEEGPGNSLTALRERKRNSTAIERDASRAIFLIAGEQLSYANGILLAKPVEADIRRVSAWRARKLDFDNTPLAEAIAEANRYSSIKIELQAPELESARISGTFEAGKNELVVEGLQSYFRLNVQRTADDRIVLTAAN